MANLSREIETYLAHRAAAGYALYADRSRLHEFARYASARGARYVKSGFAVQWASLGPSPQARQHRLGALRRFVIWARVERRTHEVPPGDVFSGRYTRKPPHIYSRKQVRSLLAEATRLQPADSLRPWTYSTLLGLLVTTGLRLSEALGLAIEDVRLDERLLVVRNGKCKKDRLVPIHGSTAKALEAYLRERASVSSESSRVFVTRDGRPLPQVTVHYTFSQLRRRLGIVTRPPKRAPRIHDLRHTFAVRALESCPEGRDNIGRHFRAISTYLGHATISSTYWYFEATGKLMKDMADAAQSFHERSQ